MSSSLCMFVLNDTATTDSYTYGHTLSLQDALPIGRCRPSARLSAYATDWGPLRRRPRPEARPGAGPHKRCGDRPRDRRGGLETIEWRSEEHTSELQSLMRISYAVFCLKKKKYEPEYPRTRCQLEHDLTETHN